MQKNQLIELQEHLERHCNVLPVSGFNSAKDDINLIKSYLLPILINDRNMEPTVIKKANQIVSFKIGDDQLLDIMNFLGGATSLDSFLKAYKTPETKGFFPYERFECPQKMNNTELPPYDAFSRSKLRNVNPLQKDYSDYQKLLSCGLKTEEAPSKTKLSKTTTFRRRKLPIFAWISWEYVYNWRLFTLVQQQRRCRKTRSNAKNACFLSQERNWHVEARVYTYEFGGYLSPQIYQRQILSIYWNR